MNKLMIQRNRMLSNDDKFPLDYIIAIPPKLLDRSIPFKDHMALFQRRSILKNIVFRIIIQVRETRIKPRLGFILKIYNRNKGKLKTKIERDNVTKQIIICLRKLYGFKIEDHHYIEHQDNIDYKYDKLFSSLNRIGRLLNHKENFIDQIGKDIDLLTVRREEREQLIGRSKKVLQDYILKNETKYSVVNMIAN